jgi:hypothetical protein
MTIWVLVAVWTMKGTSASDYIPQYTDVYRTIGACVKDQETMQKMAPKALWKCQPATLKD